MSLERSLVCRALRSSSESTFAHHETALPGPAKVGWPDRTGYSSAVSGQPATLAIPVRYTHSPVEKVRTATNPNRTGTIPGLGVATRAWHYHRPRIAAARQAGLRGARLGDHEGARCADDGGGMPLSWTSDSNVSGARPRRRRHPSGDDRETLHRLTVRAAIAAVILNAALFLQTGISQFGPVDVSSAVVSFANALFPGRGGLQPPSETPRPAPTGTAVVTSGGS